MKSHRKSIAITCDRIHQHQIVIRKMLYIVMVIIKVVVVRIIVVEIGIIVAVNIKRKNNGG